MALLEQDRQPRSTTPPQDLHAWALLGALSLIGFALIGATMTSITIFTTTMQREFGWTEVELGAGPTALLLGMSVGNLLVAPAFKRFGVRGPFWAGGLATAIGWAASGLVGALTPFVLAMAVTGVGVGVGSIVPALSILNRTFQARRAIAIGVFIGACSVASFILPVLANWVIAQTSWRLAFLLMSLFIALTSLLATLFIREPRLSGQDVEESKQTDGLSNAAVLKSPPYWMLVVILTLSQICMNAILYSAVAYFRRIGLTPEVAALVYGVANLAALPGLLCAGALADRHGPRTILLVGLIMQSIGTFCLLGAAAHDHTVRVLAIAGFILVWGMAAGVPSQLGSIVLADLIGPRAYAQMLGVIFTLGGLLGAAGPVAMGALFEVTGGYLVPIAACAAISCLTAPGVLIINRQAAKSIAV